MKTENKQRVIDHLSKTDLDFDFQYHLKDEDFDTASDIRDILDDANVFDEEIIYYGVAMEYLTKNDTSLKRSLEIAGNMGYKPENLSSEILASLLASEINRETWGEIESDLDALLDEIRDEEQGEETEETEN